MSKLEYFAVCSFFFFMYFVSLITLGFLFQSPLKSWYLPVFYFTFIIALSIFRIVKGQKISALYFVTIVCLPILFWIGIKLFGYTFDTSFDGEDYHQTAVIALSRGWNPLQNISLPVPTKEGSAFVLGYPKFLWAVQANIYQLFPTHINSATITNLFIMIVAFCFVFALIRHLGLSRIWSLVLSLLIVIQPDMIQQFFTFMEDGFSYEVSVIALMSLVFFHVSSRKKLYVVMFLLSLTLLAGIKFSNLYIVVLLGIGFIADMLFVSRNTVKTILLPVCACLIFSAILLWVPYGTNFLTYGSPFYPSNQKWAQYNLYYENTPKNLKHANKFELLFYGIYSKMQVGSAASSEKNIAELKIPFSTSLEEIAITDNFQARVAAEGVWFSGIFTVSLLFYLILLFQKKDHMEATVGKALGVFLLLSFVLALLNPVPQKLHYVPTMYLVPIGALFGILLLSHRKNFIWKAIAIVFTLLIGTNMLLKLVPTVFARNNDFLQIHSQLFTLKNSGKTYQVDAKSFYSTYIRLQEYGVLFKMVKKLHCKKTEVLPYSSYTTFYCPLSAKKSPV